MRMSPVFYCSVNADLLEMSKHVDPAVEHSLPFSSVQVIDEVGAVLCMAFLIPVLTAIQRLKIMQE